MEMASRFYIRYFLSVSYFCICRLYKRSGEHGLLCGVYRVPRLVRSRFSYRVTADRRSLFIGCARMRCLFCSATDQSQPHPQPPRPPRPPLPLPHPSSHPHPQVQPLQYRRKIAIRTIQRHLLSSKMSHKHPMMDISSKIQVARGRVPRRVGPYCRLSSPLCYNDMS